MLGLCNEEVRKRLIPAYRLTRQYELRMGPSYHDAKEAMRLVGLTHDAPPDAPTWTEQERAAAEWLVQDEYRRVTEEQDEFQAAQEKQADALEAAAADHRAPVAADAYDEKEPPRGQYTHEILNDGDCLFNAVIHQLVYRGLKPPRDRRERMVDLRQKLMEWVHRNWEHVGSFLMPLGVTKGDVDRIGDKKYWDSELGAAFLPMLARVTRPSYQHRCVQQRGALITSGEIRGRWRN